MEHKVRTYLDLKKKIKIEICFIVYEKFPKLQMKDTRVLAVMLVALILFHEGKYTVLVSPYNIIYYG